MKEIVEGGVNVEERGRKQRKVLWRKELGKRWESGQKNTREVNGTKETGEGGGKWKKDT